MKTAHHPLARRIGLAHRRSAFTLIEMLTVIAIIIILAGILLPAIARLSKIAKVNATTAMVKQIGMACKMYEQDFGFFPPESFSDVNGATTGETVKIDKPSEALWFFLGHKFEYRSTETNFNEGHASTSYEFNDPIAFAVKTSGPYMEFQNKYLKDHDGDNVPEAVDAWQQPILYNAPGGPRGDAANNYDPFHNPLSFDLFSIGPNGTTAQASDDCKFQRVLDNPANYGDWLNDCLNTAEGGNDIPADTGNPLDRPAGFDETEQDDSPNWN